MKNGKITELKAEIQQLNIILRRIEGLNALEEKIISKYQKSKERSQRIKEIVMDKYNMKRLKKIRERWDKYCKRVKALPIVFEAQEDLNFLLDLIEKLDYE